MWQVIGQERAVSLLQLGLESGKLAHAYLFTGPEYIGKMTLAKNLAQALNCELSERPCLKCLSCQKIASLRHADVQVIGLATKDEGDGEKKLISIDQIKEMQHAANLPPFEGKHKVFIIDGAELLSSDAANRLLKTLEEPVDRVTFILLTVNDRLLPLTVISRCQRLELAPMSLAAETAALTGKGIELQRARLLAGLSHGCPEWALAALEDDSLLQRRAEELDKITGVIRVDYGERFAYAAGLAAKFSQDRSAVYRALDLWRDYWRDLMLQKLGRDDMIINIDRKAELEETAGGYRLGQIKSFIDSVQSAAEQLRQNANTRLALEVLMLDIPSKEGGSVPA